MFLEDNQIKLRAVESDDLPVLYAWENDTELWSVGHAVSPYSTYTLESYIETTSQDIYAARQLRLMITLKEGGETIGAVDLFDFEPRHRRCGIGIFIAPHQQGKGYAAESLELVVNYVFDFLMLHQLYCHIPVSNTRSMDLFEKQGFVVTGRCREWLLTPQGVEDVLFLQLISDRTTPG